MTTTTAFIYQWINKGPNIRGYGLDSYGSQVCVHVNGFAPYLYLELPNRTWNPTSVNLITKHINFILQQSKPSQIILRIKQQFYYASRNRQRPYLMCVFKNEDDKLNAYNRIHRRRMVIDRVGTLKCTVHEHNVPTILQMICQRSIPSCGWIEFTDYNVRQLDNMVTSCDIEYDIRWTNIHPHNNNNIPTLTTLSFDIEANSSVASSMPCSDRPDDRVFQISCVVSRGDVVQAYLLSLGNPKQEVTGEDVTILTFDKEVDLLLGFSAFVTKTRPNIISGYNIIGFDFKYMIDRCRLYFCNDDFIKMGFHNHYVPNVEERSWSSSGAGYIEYTHIDIEGILIVDMYILIKREYKLNNYRLETVAEKFLDQHKDPITYRDIFKYYKEGMTGTAEGDRKMGVVGKYCVMDSMLVHRLLTVLNSLVGLVEMAKVTNVGVMSVIFDGQTVKIFSQIYNYCVHNNIVFENHINGYKTDDTTIVGAKVFAPQPGLYNNVVPFDFASLYPSIIISHNLSYDTFVHPDDHSYSDHECEAFEWSDCVKCEHDENWNSKLKIDKEIEEKELYIKHLMSQRDEQSSKVLKTKIQTQINELRKELSPIKKKRAELKGASTLEPMCVKRSYRFVKSPLGIIPTIIKNLLDARKATKDQMKELPKDSFLRMVLNQRQLSLKVSANSIYGAMSMGQGKLSFIPCGRTITYMGRTHIQKVAQMLTASPYNAQFIYGDTDSNYVCFNQIQNHAELWNYCTKVAKEISSNFPPPMKLEFEEAVYNRFFIISKKIYMYYASDLEGNVSSKLGYTGGLLTKRDSCLAVKQLYQFVIETVFKGITLNDLIPIIVEQIVKLFITSKYDNFILSKQLRNVENMTAQNIVNEHGKRQIKLGEYVINSLLPTDEKLRSKKITCNMSETDYYKTMLPAWVYLATKVISRGGRVASGSRIEYVVLQTDNNFRDKLVRKVEELDYYKTFRGIMDIDYMHYIEACINPIDKILQLVFNQPILIHIYTVCKYKYLMNKELLGLHSPEFVLEE